MYYTAVCSERLLLVVEWFYSTPFSLIFCSSLQMILTVHLVYNQFARSFMWVHWRCARCRKVTRFTCAFIPLQTLPIWFKCLINLSNRIELCCCYLWYASDVCPPAVSVQLEKCGSNCKFLLLLCSHVDATTCHDHSLHNSLIFPHNFLISQANNCWMI